MQDVTRQRKIFEKWDYASHNIFLNFKREKDCLNLWARQVLMMKWTVRISSRLYLAVVLPPNTELRRMFSLSFGYQTFGTLAVSEWVTEWLSDLAKHYNKIRESNLSISQFQRRSWKVYANDMMRMWGVDSSEFRIINHKMSKLLHQCNNRNRPEQWLFCNLNLIQ